MTISDEEENSTENRCTAEMDIDAMLMPPPPNPVNNLDNEGKFCSHEFLIYIFNEIFTNTNKVFAHNRNVCTHNARFYYHRWIPSVH